MARFSASGKRIGRPPKAQQPQAEFTDQEKMVGRAMLKFMNRYDAAGRGRRMAGWNAPSTGPNDAINAGLQTLRDRSSDAVRNDWSAESIVQKWGTTLIGIGITPRFRRVQDKTRRQEITDKWNVFVKQADAECVLNLYGLQTLAVRSWLERGEMFARRRWRNDPDLGVQMQVQLLEADMVPNFNADTYEGLPVRNKIRAGIEYNRQGKRVAYWVYKEHPGDTLDGMINAGPAPDNLVRVLAEDMAHVFEPKRIGQRRGVSILAPVLARLRNINDYEDTTLERQKVANLFVAFITRALPTLDPTDPNVNYGDLTGLPVDLDDSGAPLVPMRPGLMQELEDGQDIKFANPPDPATNYSDYMRTSHLGTMAGGGMPYELGTGDIANVSDRTLRVLINEYRRFAEQRQWQIVIPQFCQRVTDWFADALLLQGDITQLEYDAVSKPEHAPHGWAYIHPVQDVQGKAMEVTNGFRSRSSVIGQAGDDPEQVDLERAEDMEREKELDLWVDPNSQPAGSANGNSNQTVDTTGQDGIDNNEYSAPPNPSGDNVRARLGRLMSEAEKLQALFAGA